MKKFFKFIAGALSLLLVAAAVFAGLFLYSGVKEADDLQTQRPIEQLAAQVQASPDYVPYDQISPMLLQATTAIEDTRYMEHGAIDLRSLLRAALSQVVPGMPKSGGSTIEMQTVKNLYGVWHGDAKWKAAEIVLAHRLSKLYSKEEILALYVNIINYGSDYHGISQAAAGYYGLAPIQLSDGMATLLAGVPQSPAYYSPRTHFEQARAKQQLVLAAMVRRGDITEQQAQEIFAQPCQPYFALQQPCGHSNLLTRLAFL